MLDRLLSSFIPTDPFEAVVSFIEGEDITLTIGDKLRVELVIIRDPEQKNAYKFRGRLVRGHE